MNLFKPQIKLLKGTKFISFLFISFSVLIAAGILWAANMYYNIDTGEVVIEEVQRITGVLRATAGAIIGGSSTQNPSSGYNFEVVGSTKLATTTISSGELSFVGSDTYAGFKAPSSYGTTTTMIYQLPQHGVYVPQSDYVLTWQSGGELRWKEVTGVGGAGDVTDVGDCSSGQCFTSTGTSGSSLWFFQQTGPYRLKLTRDTLSGNRTITLPDNDGTIALGTSTANYVAYWANTNTLTGEAQLATSRGGTGADSSAWSGMVRVVGGSWGAVTGTSSYAAYWSDANTVSAEQYLSVVRGGTGAGSFTQYGVIYGNNTSALGVTPVGTTNQLLISGGGVSAPSWSNIADLITATNGLTESGTTNLTIKLGGALTENTTITQGNFDAIFALSGTGDFRITDGTNNIFQVTNDGKVLFGPNNYPISESGKEILREMIPIFGFDLPAQTATTSYVKISRTIDAYPFSSLETGATRVHRFVVRYTDNLPLASSTNWRVATTSGSSFSTFDLPGRNNSGLDAGFATTTPDVAIPTDGTDWWLEVKSQEPYDTYKVKVFQIFLAAYDKIQ